MASYGICEKHEECYKHYFQRPSRLKTEQPQCDGNKTKGGCLRPSLKLVIHIGHAKHAQRTDKKEKASNEEEERSKNLNYNH